MYDAQLTYLKKTAPIYPEIHFEKLGDRQWAATMLMFEHDGTTLGKYIATSIGVSYDSKVDRLRTRIEEQAERLKTHPSDCEVIGVEFNPGRTHKPHNGMTP